MIKMRRLQTSRGSSRAWLTSVTRYLTPTCTLPFAVGERFDGRFEDWWLSEHVTRHPIEMMYASTCIVNGGVLERFPGLRVAFLEANCSWVPYWLWRMDEHYEIREKLVKKTLPQKPSPFFLKQCFVSSRPTSIPPARCWTRLPPTWCSRPTSRIRTAPVRKPPKPSWSCLSMTSKDAPSCRATACGCMDLPLGPK